MEILGFMEMSWDLVLVMEILGFMEKSWNLGPRYEILSKIFRAARFARRAFYIHLAFFTHSTDPYRFANVCFPSFLTFSVRIQWRKPGCTATGAHLLPIRGTRKHLYFQGEKLTQKQYFQREKLT